jgi:hypothetical protein
VNKRLRAWCVNALLTVGAAVVTLGCVELGLRLFYPQPLGVWHQDTDGLALHWPGLVTYLPQFGHVVSINSEGMRDREHTVPKADGIYRVLILGDSFMEALQLPFEASFPSLLERELGTRTGIPIEVVNASVSGWGTDDELTYLEKYGARWEPDLILVALTLHNDVKDNLRERFHRNQKGALSEGWQRPLSSHAFHLIELKGFLASRSHAYQLFLRSRRLGERRVEAEQLNAHVADLLAPTTSRELARGLELTRLLLERINLIAAEHKATVTVVLLPLALQVSGEASEGLVTLVGTATAALAMDQPQRLLRDVTQRAGVEMIDLLPQFRAWAAAGGPRLYLERDGHWTESGHRVAAGVVASELVRRGFVQR